MDNSHDRPMPAAPVVPGDRARQGITPGVVRYVLAISLLLAIAGLVLTYALG